MTTKTALKPDWPWSTRLGISQGVRIGDTVYVSGQVAFDPDGNVVGQGDMGAQARRVFQNMRDVLETAGASMGDVVKITAFLVDMSQYSDYAAARTEAFPNGDVATATVGAPTLVSPDLLVEVEAIAQVGAGS